MDNYSKNVLKSRRYLRLLIVFLILILAITVSFVIYIKLKNNITYEKLDNSASLVSDDVAINSTPIIINNLLIGALYNNTWVSTERYYFNSKNTSEVSINVYNSRGKAGTYTLKSISKGNGTSVYTATTNTNIVDEYIAVASGDNNIMSNPATKDLNVTEQDISSVKKALGIYRLFNTSIKITEAYNLVIENSGYGRILCVTNEQGKSFGVYSAIVYVNPQGKASLVKYNYVSDKEKSESWPIYSFCFVTDINNDGTNEIIIQETKEFEVKYDILEYKNNKFVEVLSTNVKI